MTHKQPLFLPMTRKEMKKIGWNELDVLLISGDAYVDHHSFGMAVIGRWLVAQGWRVGLIAQPDWKNVDSVQAMGRPKLFAGITAGAMDSMIANYTANKKLRRDDAYTPGGEYGKRPNRASIIYTNLIKHAFPGLPIVLGGVEASLRRIVHYDYWDDKIRRSILLDSKADYIAYGMAEHTIAEIAQCLFNKKSPEAINGLAWISKIKPSGKQLPGYEEILNDSVLLAKAALEEESERHWKSGHPLIQQHGTRYIIVNPPSKPLTSKQMDQIYNLPFQRKAHPSYTESIPALNSVQTSITTHRGCFGGCSFCALGAHQGKIIQSRSEENILKEIRHLTEQIYFRGTLTDIGGPSANMYGLVCQCPEDTCDRPSCLFPNVCKFLKTNQKAVRQLLSKIKNIKSVKHAFVASGIRYDLALLDQDYISQMVSGGHVSGTLKTAPEHSDPKVLAMMRKPVIEKFETFVEAYRKASQREKKEGYLTAYFIASFPGSDDKAMRNIAAFAKKQRIRVEQCQDFIPLPMTLAGIMYALERNIWTKEKIVVAKKFGSRQRQKKLLLDQVRSGFEKQSNGKKRYKSKVHSK